MMQTVRMINYWRKNERVKAVQITEFNIRLVATAIQGAFWGGVEGKNGADALITLSDGVGRIGDWAVEEEGKIYFLSDEKFLKRFETHTERASYDDKYAMVFQSVLSAMSAQDSARFHNDSNGEMDLVAAAATRRILRGI